MTLLRDYSVPSAAAWGSPLLYIFPCCLIEMVRIFSVLVFFVSYHCSNTSLTDLGSSAKQVLRRVRCQLSLLLLLFGKVVFQCHASSGVNVLLAVAVVTTPCSLSLHPCVTNQSASADRRPGSRSSIHITYHAASYTPLISCGWNFACSHIILLTTSTRYDSDPSDAAWGMPPVV